MTIDPTSLAALVPTPQPAIGAGSASSLRSASALAAAGLPPIDQASLPADVRNASPKQKQVYNAALGFERMLLGELTKEMAATANPAGSSDSSGGSDPSASSGTDAASSIYQQMLPDQLATAMTAGGGVGLADQLYQSLQGPGAHGAPSAPAGQAPSAQAGATQAGGTR